MNQQGVKIQPAKGGQFSTGVDSLGSTGRCNTRLLLQ